MAIVTAKINF